MSTPDQPEEPMPATATEAIERVFGADNRARLLKRYFDANGTVTPENAWRHVYRLLLWIDRTTALAHCYESDKAQPGRPWYERSLAFHDWLATALGLAPAELGDGIDWLFREAIGDLASQAVASRSAAYEKQRAPYVGRGFPEPGEDPELVGIIRELLSPWMDRRPPDEELRKLTRRIHAHLNQRIRRRAYQSGLRTSSAKCTAVHARRAYQSPGNAGGLWGIGPRGGKADTHARRDRTAHGLNHLAEERDLVVIPSPWRW